MFDSLFSVKIQDYDFFFQEFQIWPKKDENGRKTINFKNIFPLSCHVTIKNNVLFQRFSMFFSNFFFF